MNLNTILAVVVAAALSATAASACDRTLSLLTMTEDGFRESATVTVDPRMLVCDYDHRNLQEQVDQMRQQRGWYGSQWEDGGVVHRLTDPAVSRWTEGFSRFFNGDVSSLQMM